MSIRITEVAARDGLQNEPRRVSTESKVAFIDQLSAAGPCEIEVTSFVSARWVPQLGDASDVLARITRRPGTVYSALVPNEQGLDRALECRLDKIAVFVSATESFSQRNTNGSIHEVLSRLAPVVARAREAGLIVRGYISCAIRCPFEGTVAPEAVRVLCARLIDLGVHEIDLGDTLGAADPDSIARLYEGLSRTIDPGATTLHLHDTNGRALECALGAIELGVRSFDGSAGGLGGCPYAPGSPGNLATETLVRALDARGIDTGVDAQRLEAAGRWMRQQLTGDSAASS